MKFYYKPFVAHSKGANFLPFKWEPQVSHPLVLFQEICD